MLTEKPKLTRIKVTALDMDTRKSKSTTLYETTPEDVIAKSQVRRAEQPTPDQQQPAALAS
jgi:hypothetical protein